MKKIRVAGAQMAVTGDVSGNLETILRAIEFAQDERADILLTPEGSLSGYTHEFDRAAVSAALARAVGAARERGVGLALGVCFEEPDGRCYNQVRFYERDGTFLGFHSKILRTTNRNDLTKGEYACFAETPLRVFSFQGVPVGALICNDMWATPGCAPYPDPHLCQQLAGMGARIVFHAVNGGRSGSALSRVVWNYHESNLQLRARAAKAWIVTVDNCAPPEIPCSAPSGAVNPHGWWDCRTRPQGEHFFAHTIDLTSRPEGS